MQFIKFDDRRTTGIALAMRFVLSAAVVALTVGRRAEWHNGSSAQFLSAQRPNVPTAAVGGILPAQSTEFGRHNGRQIAVTFPNRRHQRYGVQTKATFAEELHDRECNF
jgi:hypothetical protein